MNEIEQLQFDQDMLQQAMDNTYQILTQETTMKSLKDVKGKSGFAILFDPHGKDYSPKFPHLHNTVDKNELIDSMIEFYIESEEYEKCTKLVKFKNKYI